MTRSAVRTGTPDTVSGFDTDEMLRYHDAHYDRQPRCRRRGNVDHAVLVDPSRGVVCRFAHWPLADRPKVDSRERTMLSCVKKEDRAGGTSSSRPQRRRNNDPVASPSLLDIIIGGGMSSRLFQEIREKRGLVYSVYASSQPYEGAGIFEMYAGTRPENVAEVVKVATEQFALAAQDGVSDDELAARRSRRR